MTYILTFSTTQMIDDVGNNDIKTNIWSTIDPIVINTKVFGTGAITKFVASTESNGFNFSLQRMASRVECEEVPMPANLTSVEDLDKWLMELDLE